MANYRRNPWPLVNVVSFILTIVMNALANALPINGLTTGDVSDSLPSLFTPASFTFAIWGVIYTLLGIFVVVQSGILPNTRRSAQQTVDAVGPWFAISSVANALWIVAWHYQQLALSVIIMLVLLVSIVAISQRLLSRPAAPITHLAFSVYLGWISVATIANVTAALVNRGWDGWGVPQSVWTVAVIVVAGLLGAYYLYSRRDIWYSAVIVWALFGIVYRHLTELQFKYVSVIVAAGAVILFLLYGVGQRLFVRSTHRVR